MFTKNQQRWSGNPKIEMADSSEEEEEERLLPESVLNQMNWRILDPFLSSQVMKLFIFVLLFKTFCIFKSFQNANFGHIFDNF